MTRPFRFGVNLLEPTPLDAWRAKCRRGEELGYDVLLVPDHLGMPAPFPSLVAAAQVTTRPRVGTFVLNTGFFNPVLLAREVSTTAALTGGRLELGLGAGYVRAEHEEAGLPWGTPGERVTHLRCTVEELRKRQEDGVHVPLLIGGNGTRMLRLAAEHADVVAFAGARVVEGSATGQITPLSPEELDERVAAYAELAAGRAEPAERNLLIQQVIVTDDPEGAVQPLLERIPGLTAEQVLALPVLLVGSEAEIAAKVRALRERYGFTYFTVLEGFMEAFGPVLAELQGRAPVAGGRPDAGMSVEGVPGVL
ncbi:TIGR03621 family F420-dependent LLM class oxidoreductase [Streptomyces roseirectus]|uniref:TIGR03621 family F420-dependent LLM class oxidoreductase n=1 Tax=Streptomyces roseirectus TaxID=2768066 RepID=A0A7H0IMJ5_9ACTN|nr:TIGR03621 family F420-dependent LLM class oxidoreductase [Streptomyces roseirectus]QNP74011.1 TIGR03621 family F420-dependent LLM class oxidoreductase [Streptomyces roseirectus]